MSPISRLIFPLTAVLALLASPAAAAAPPSVALQLLPGAPEIDPAALRDAVGRELDATVLDAAAGVQAPVTIVVGIDRPRGELVVARRDGTGSVSRRVPLPADPGATLRAAVFLIGNLARDEAADVLRELAPPPPVAPPPPPEAVSPPPRSRAPRARDEGAQLWIGVAGEYDFVFVQSAGEVCRLGSAGVPLNVAGYYCVDDGGTDFPSRDPGAVAQNAGITPNVSDRVAGGVAPANARATISLDYAASPNLLVGARLGYVANTYPGEAAKNEGKSFPPVHAELRATYVFGHEPLLRGGAAPYVMIAGGVAQWSAQVPVTVVSAGASGSQVTSAHAWEISGPGFGGVGAGVRWAITPRLALSFGQRLNVAFGAATLISTGPELGVQLGL